MVDTAVRHILSIANVVYLCWGTKMIHLDSERHAAPAILRRKPMKVMFNEYITQQNDKSKVSRMLFYRLAVIHTHGSTQPRTPVSYVTGFLIDDHFALLTRIVCDLLPETTLQ